MAIFASGSLCIKEYNCHIMSFSFSRIFEVKNGDYWTFHCTHTQFYNRPWWEADLGEPYHVHSVRIYNRDKHGNNINRFILIQFAGKSTRTATNSECNVFSDKMLHFSP